MVALDWVDLMNVTSGIFIISITGSILKSHGVQTTTVEHTNARTQDRVSATWYFSCTRIKQQPSEYRLSCIITVENLLQRAFRSTPGVTLRTYTTFPGGKSLLGTSSVCFCHIAYHIPWCLNRRGLLGTSSIILRTQANL